MRNTVYKLRVAEPFFSINASNICTFSHLHICTVQDSVEELLLSGLGTLCTVLRTALCTVGNTGSIECTANDVVTNTRKVLYTTTADKHHGVLLEVVTFAGDVGRYFHAVDEADTANLTKSRVRLLRRGGVHTGAHATLLRVALERRRLGLGDSRLAALADQLINSRQVPSPSLLPGFAQPDHVAAKTICLLGLPRVRGAPPFSCTLSWCAHENTRRNTARVGTIRLEHQLVKRHAPGCVYPLR